MSLLLKIMLFPFKLIAAIAMCAVGAVILVVAIVFYLAHIIVTLVVQKLIILFVVLFIAYLFVTFSVGMETDQDIGSAILTSVLVVGMLVLSVVAPVIFENVGQLLMKVGIELHCLAISLVFGV